VSFHVGQCQFFHHGKRPAYVGEFYIAGCLAYVYEAKRDLPEPDRPVYPQVCLLGCLGHFLSFCAVSDMVMVS